MPPTPSKVEISKTPSFLPTESDTSDAPLIGDLLAGNASRNQQLLSFAKRYWT
jgi:hypothetical protein